MRLLLIGLLGWAAAVVLATGVGFAAISLVGDDPGGSIIGVELEVSPEPTPEATAAQTRRPRSTTPATPETTRSTPRSPAPRVTTSRVTAAGTVTASCRSAGARLVSWSPSNGWSVQHVVTTGPQRQVVFTDGTRTVTVDVRCAGRVPRFDVTEGQDEPDPEPSATSTPLPSDTQSVAPADQP